MPNGENPNIASATEILAGRLRFQAEACRRLGSPLYGVLLVRAAGDVEDRGPAWEVLCGHECDPGPSALALRLMGAVNRLVIDGSEPALAAVYADPEGADTEQAWVAFNGVLDRRVEELRRLVELPVQTNEVGRGAALLSGFLAVAAETKLPLRLLEVGASAGLNLRWDAHRYLAGEFSWGPSESPVEIKFALRGGPCRAWTASRSPSERVVTEPPSWIGRKLSVKAGGMATVVYHSLVMQYLSEDERDLFAACVREAGERASADAPLAWLRMEWAGERAEVLLTNWPGGEERLLARAGYHGDPVELLQ